MLSSDYFEGSKEYPVPFLFTTDTQSLLPSAGKGEAMGKLSEIQAQS